MEDFFIEVPTYIENVISEMGGMYSKLEHAKESLT